ncbi:Afadin and alpha-actinin-binding-domain-containing protein [Xylariaceae sp. FL0016]|nr:Afadin and alpha-actinin-binding-domain-containing protein [Xylariaceae sp. FL0016]
MIDSENLRTASLYINNQLLSRGLLRDGHNINFADPESAEGGLYATMGRVMSVVNDLILRRDRDAEHRESLSTTLRDLRSESQRQATNFTRQSEKLADTQRQVQNAEATERALRSQLKIAEHSVHKLRDELAKLKALVVQSRAACATEVRKRDRQIDSLKKAVSDAGRVRGGGRNRDVITISVTGEVGQAATDEGAGIGATDNEDYSLREETNEFLTELAKGLSEENEGLLALVKRSVDALREMSGLERNLESVDDEPAVNGDGDEDVFAQPPQKSAGELAAELEAVVEHLRSILTNPSFVPIEEVEVRDEALAHLRAGLETMEERWKDAVHMIDGWRKRMVSSGKSVDMEDLQMSLRLSPVRVQNVLETADVIPLKLSCVREEEEEEEEEEAKAVLPEPKQQREPEPPRSPSLAESLHLVPAPDYEMGGNEDEDEDESDDSYNEDFNTGDMDAEEPNVQVLQESTATSVDSPPLPKPPQISPLKDSYTSGNRGSVHDRKKPGDFTTIVEEDTWDLADAEETAPPPPPHIIIPQSPTERSVKGSPTAFDPDRPGSTASYESPLFGTSGERPSQAQPAKKLFSKPSNATGHARTKSAPKFDAGKNNASSGGRKSPLPPSSSSEPKPAKRTASDPDVPRQQAPAPAQTSKSTTDRVKPGAPAPRNRSPIRPAGSSRLPRLNPPAPQQSPLTMERIQAKLAAAEREADAARVRAKLRAVRKGRRTTDHVIAEEATLRMVEGTPPPGPASVSGAPAPEDTDPVKKAVESEPKPTPPQNQKQGQAAKSSSPLKRQRPVELDEDEADELVLDASLGSRKSVCSGELNAVVEKPRARDRDGEGKDKAKRKRDRRTSRVASRRRSTLNPWELQSLIQGGVSDSPARKS